MATTNDGSNEVRPPGPSPENDSILTRTGVASILGCSPSSVRRMEGNVLHPTLDANAVHRFSLAEVLELQKKRSAEVGGATKDGQRDASAFEIFGAGGGIRDVVLQLRVAVDIAERLYDKWRRAGVHDVVVTPQIQTELANALGAFRDTRDLVQRAREQAAENDRLHSDLDAIRNRTSDVAFEIRELAARIPWLADALRDILAIFGDEASEVLDHSLECATPSAPSAASADERHQAPLAAPQAATVCPVASPQALVRDAPARTNSPPPASAEQRREVATDGASASAQVHGADAPAASTRPASSVGRERLLDQLLASLVSDDLRLQELGALLQRTEIVMLAELERTVGAVGDGKRMEILDALLVSVSHDEARLERIKALLTRMEVDLLIQLRDGGVGLTYHP